VSAHVRGSCSGFVATCSSNQLVAALAGQQRMPKSGRRNWRGAMPAQRLRVPGQARGHFSPEKITVTCESPVGDISVVTLIRTDTTLAQFELQSQTTRLVEDTCHDRTSQADTGVSPSLLPFSKRLGSGRRSTMLLQTTIRHRTYFCTDSHGELFPLQSPLLGKSLLVSFPPLNYMLKFSG